LGNVSTVETQFLGSDGNVLACYIPLSGKLSAPGGVKLARLRIKVAGRVTTAASVTFTPIVYWGTSTTIGSNTALTTQVTPTLASVSSNWSTEVFLTWDATSGKLNGYYTGQSDVTRKADTTVANVATSVDLAAGDSTSIGITVTGQFSATAGATAHAFVDQLEVEVY
jgi:hypothetical protein